MIVTGKLSDIYTFQYGKGNDNPDNGGIYPVYGSNGIIGGYDKYNNEDAPVIGHIGANAGSVVYAKGKHYVTYNGVMCRIKANADKMYGYYALLASNIKQIAFGSAQPFVSYSTLNRIAIYLPTIEKQKKISSILSAYDDLIEVNNKRIKVLEQMAENLYKEWFVRFRFPGYETAEFENGLPKGWGIEKTKNICRITTGKKDVNQTDAEGKYPFFSCAREDTLFSDDAFIDGEAILIAGNGSYTGFTKCYRGKFDLYQRTYALYGFNTIPWQYLYWTFKLGFEKEHMGGSHGSAIPYITKPVIEKYKIIIPDQETLAAASQVFNRIYDLCEVLKQENRKLTIQRDLLLPRLMSGKLEICTEA